MKHWHLISTTVYLSITTKQLPQVKQRSWPQKPLTNTLTISSALPLSHTWGAKPDGQAFPIG